MDSIKPNQVMMENIRIFGKGKQGGSAFPMNVLIDNCKCYSLNSVLSLKKLL